MPIFIAGCGDGNEVAAASDLKIKTVSEIHLQRERTIQSWAGRAGNNSLQIYEIYSQLCQVRTRVIRAFCNSNKISLPLKISE